MWVQAAGKGMRHMLRTGFEIKPDAQGVFNACGKYLPLHLFHKELYDGQSQAGGVVALLPFHVKPFEYSGGI